MVRHSTARKVPGHRAPTHRKPTHRMTKRRMGTLSKVGALLAAPLPDVELLIGTMANPDSGIKFVVGIAKKAGKRLSEVQSVIFDKLKWTADSAKQWLQDHGFSGSGKDEGATFWRFRQQSPGKFKEFRTIVPGTRQNPGLRLGRRTRYVVYALPGTTSDTGIAQKLRETVPVFQSDDFVEATEEAMRLKRERGMKVWLRDTQEDRFRGQYPPIGLEDQPKENPAGDLWAVIRDGSEVVRAGRAWTEEDARTALAAMVPQLLERGVRLSRYTIGKVRHHPGGGYVPMKSGLFRPGEGEEMRANPDVADAITSYDEHLGMTTRPEFQEATPGEQAAAMTAMDLAENPNVPTPVELQTPFSQARVRDFGLTLVHQLGGGPRNYLHEVGVHGQDPDAVKYLQDAGYHKSHGWLDRSRHQWWVYRKEYPLSVAKWAEQNPIQNPSPVVLEIQRQLIAQGLNPRLGYVAMGPNTLKVSMGTNGAIIHYDSGRDLYDVTEYHGFDKLPTQRGIYVEALAPQVHAALAPREGYGEFRENPDLGDMEVALSKAVATGDKAEARKISRQITKWLKELDKGMKRNPESEAAALYEDFHGKPPGETLEIVTDKLEHEWLTQLGLLVELKVATLTNLDATLSFTKDAPNLCSSEDGRQLYIEDGDQALDLKALKMDGDKWLKDSMVIGVAYELTYQTEKGFQQFKLTDYFHHLGEETGVQPFLLYDPRNQLLSISGGQYQVKDVGIVN